MSEFNRPLADIYNAIHPIEAKNKFVTYLNRYEKPSLRKGDLLTLKKSVHNLKKLLDVKKQQILVIVQQADMNRIESFLGEIRRDTRTLLLIKKAICTAILKKLKDSRNPGGQADTQLFKEYKAYLVKLNWFFKSENKIMNYLVQTLQKARDLHSRSDLLEKCRGVILGRIKDEQMLQYAGDILDAWRGYYVYMGEREAGPVADTESGDTQRKDSSVADETTGAEKAGQSEVLTGTASTQDQGLQLPDFSEDDEAFINRLADMEKASSIVGSLEGLSPSRREEIVTQVSFDPRFDRFYADIMSIQGDVGQLLGLVSGQVKKLEQQYGYQASEEFIMDLIARVQADNEAGNHLIKKIENFYDNLVAVHERSTRRLQIMRDRLEGKNIKEQVKTLQEMSRDVKFRSVFGTVRNLERLALENHFEEIFNGLPLEVQKVIGETFLTDLADLREYHPGLLKKLEKKMDEVTKKLEQSYHELPAIDMDYLDKILQAAGVDGPDSMEELHRLTREIYAQEGGSGGYHDLGVITAGDYEHTPGDFLENLEETNETEENLQIREIIRVMREIDRIPSLNEKIKTIRFWLQNEYYENPYVQNFLQGQLEALEKNKIREGGMLRRIFDKLEKIEKVEEKVVYLKKMREDPDYYHLIPILDNLIQNIPRESRLKKGLITKEFITAELEKLENFGAQLDWLKARRLLKIFAAEQPFMDEKIRELEKKQANARIEGLLEDLAVKEAADSVQAKRNQGLKFEPLQDIFSLGREVLNLSDKLARRRFIKEQEAIYPLGEEKTFQKQRRMLYYLVNVDPGEKPARMLQALGSKLLLNFEKKKEYFTLLKRAVQEQADERVSLLEMLGLTSEDLALGAAEIVVFEKQSVSGKLALLEEMRGGKVKLEEVKYADNNGNFTSEKYEDFFEINLAVLNQLIVKYKKLLRESGQAADPETEMLLVDDSFNLEAGAGEQGNGTAAAEAGSISGGSGEGADETGTHDKGQVGTMEDLLVAPDSITAGDAGEGGMENPLQEDVMPEPGMPAERSQPEAEPAPSGQKSASHGEDNGAAVNPELDIRKQGSKGYKHYMENRLQIDEVVKEKISVQAKSGHKDEEKRIVKQLREDQEEFRKQPEAKLVSIIRQLNSCRGELIPEMINQTILPLLTEVNDTEIRDLITILDQNLFSPILLNGANISLKPVLEGIESFMHKEGVFKGCYHDLEEIKAKLIQVREKFINWEIQQEMHQLAAITRAGKSGDVDTILKNLLKMEPPESIIQEFEKKYLAAFADKPEQKALTDKLTQIRDVILAQTVDWGDKNTFSEKTRQLILQVRDRFRNTPEKASAVSAGDITGTEPDSPLVAKMLEAAEFVNPVTYLKSVEKTGKIKPGSGDYGELVDKLSRAGKIFSYDKKHYIGYGKLYEFIQDKNNIGYSRNKLAKELLVFLNKLPSLKYRLNFLGIPGDEFEDFIQKIQYWAAHSDAETAEAKKRRPPRKMPSPARRGQSAGAEKEKKVSAKQDAKRTPGTRSAEVKPKAGTKSRSKPKAKPKPVKPKQVASRELLSRLNKMITDKLLFLVKEYDSRRMLQMLQESYLDPRAKRSNLLMLIDQAKYRKLYETIKDDRELHQRLSFDRDVVKRALARKMKKVRK